MWEFIRKYQFACGINGIAIDTVMYLHAVPLIPQIELYKLQYMQCVIRFKLHAMCHQVQIMCNVSSGSNYMQCVIRFKLSAMCHQVQITCNVSSSCTNYMQTVIRFNSGYLFAVSWLPLTICIRCHWHN
jgi:hypothetical protein